MLQHIWILGAVLVLYCSGAEPDCDVIETIHVSRNEWISPSTDKAHCKLKSSSKITYFFVSKKQIQIPDKFIDYEIRWSTNKALRIYCRHKDDHSPCDKVDYSLSFSDLNKICTVCPASGEIQFNQRLFTFTSDFTFKIDITYPSSNGGNRPHAINISAISRTDNRCSFKYLYNTFRKRDILHSCDRNCFKNLCDISVPTGPTANSNYSFIPSSFTVKVVIGVTVTFIGVAVFILLLYKMLPLLRSLNNRADIPSYQKSGLLISQQNCDSCYSCYCKSSSDVSQSQPVEIHTSNAHLANWLTNLNRYSEVAQQEHRSESVSRDIQLNLPVSVPRCREDSIAPPPTLQPTSSSKSNGPFSNLSNLPYLGPLTTPAPNKSPFDHINTKSLRPQRSSLDQVSVASLRSDFANQQIPMRKLSNDSGNCEFGYAIRESTLDGKNIRPDKCSVLGNGDKNPN